MIKKTALFAALLLLLALVALTGCRSAPEVNGHAEPSPRRARVAEMPSPEELGDNPCGNPDWAKLPPGVGEYEEARAEDSHADEEPPEEE